MPKNKKKEWKIEDALDSKEMIAAYLDLIFKKGNPLEILGAIGDVLGSKGMSKIAKKAKLNRSNLYKTFSRIGNIDLITLIKILDVLNLKLSLKRPA